MNLNLASKTALITAGSKGMGRAIALAFARESMNVAIAARGNEALDATAADVRALGAEVLAIEGDVSKGDDIQKMVGETVERFGGIDALVANAGGRAAKTFDLTNDADWRAAVDLNRLSVVRLIRASLPHLEERRGNVITIESISVKQPVPRLILSNAVRAAVIGLVKTLADEVGPKGVRLNNILPGMIMTDRARSLAQTRASAEGITPEQVISETSKAIPLRRYGDPEEIANLAVFLASDAASYITGTSILCDGGLYRGFVLSCQSSVISHPRRYRHHEA